MRQSFKDWLRELASAAGVSEEQFLKVAGVIHLIPLTPPGSIPSPSKSLVLRLLEAKRVANFRELQEELHVSGEDLKPIIRELEAEGKACTVDTYAYGPLLALTDDGTLSLAELDARDRAAVVSATYANKSLNLTYRNVLELYRKTTPQPSAAERILEQLGTGPKRYTDLLKAGIPKAQIYPTLKKLMEQGRVKRAKRGVYLLSS